MTFWKGFVSTCACFLSLMSLGTMQEVSAATIYLIDFGTTGNTTTVDGNGNHWNNLTGAQADPDVNPRSGSILLHSIDGTPGITMNYAFPTGGSDPNFSNKNATNHPASLGSLPNLGLMNVDSATRDVIWAGGTFTLTFTGLDPLLEYSFDVFAYRSYLDRSSNYQVLGSESSAIETQQVGYTKDDGGSYLSFNGYRPDANGNIVLRVTPGAGNYSYLSAVQLTVTPEPGRALLLAGGIVALTMRRRRVKSI